MPPNVKQGRLPGMQPKHILELEEKAEELKEFETERMEAGEREEKARDELGGLMDKHKLTHYALDEDREVVIEEKKKAYVRKIKRVKTPKKDGNGA